MMSPKMFDPKIKNQIINQNIYHSGYGNYKICPMSQSIKFFYRGEYDPGAIDKICKVIVHNKHALDVASVISQHGLNSLTANNQNNVPAIVYPLGKDFLGTNFESREGIYDENIVLRTNYAYIIKKQSDLFPIKEGSHSVVYSNPIVTIRDNNYNPLQLDNIYKSAIISLVYDRKHDLIVDKVMNGEKFTENNVLASSDLLNFQIQLETACQTALCGFHDVIIFSIFDRDFGIPPDDQVLMFNNIIMKYGHKFKSIMICIPQYEDKDIFGYFDREIIKPQTLVNDIEMKYKAEAMASRIKNEKPSTISLTGSEILNNDNISKMTSLTSPFENPLSKDINDLLIKNKNKQTNSTKNLTK